MLDFFDFNTHFSSNFLGKWFATEILDQAALRPNELVDRFDHVYRNADRARLVGDRPGNRLADPPGGVGRKLVAALVVELVDGPEQAGVPLLNQVEQRQT